MLLTTSLKNFSSKNFKYIKYLSQLTNFSTYFFINKTKNLFYKHQNCYVHNNFFMFYKKKLLSNSLFLIGNNMPNYKQNFLTPKLHPRDIKLQNTVVSNSNFDFNQLTRIKSLIRLFKILKFNNRLRYKVFTLIRNKLLPKTLLFTNKNQRNVNGVNITYFLQIFSKRNLKKTLKNKRQKFYFKAKLIKHSNYNLLYKNNFHKYLYSLPLDFKQPIQLGFTKYEPLNFLIFKPKLQVHKIQFHKNFKLNNLYYQTESKLYLKNLQFKNLKKYNLTKTSMLKTLYKKNIYIFKKINHTCLYSKYFPAFILKNTGFFLTYQNNALNHTSLVLNKSQFKKKLFSFLFPEQEKKAIFLRKKKLTLKSILLNSFKTIKYNSFFTFKNLKKFFLSRNFDLKSELPKIFNYTNSSIDVLFKNHFLVKGTDNRYFHAVNELRLSRIRFKPGYQKLWRQARKALKVNLDLNYTYQKQLTKHITRYYKQVNRYLFSSSESSAQNIILYSLIVPDLTTLNNFFTKHFFYLNGSLLLDKKKLILANDFVQLIISNWYYITFKWLQNWTIVRNKKLKRLIYKKGLASKYKLMKTKKTRSYYTPTWITKTRYDNYDIKPYLEVDYLTLSFFVLYEPFLTMYYSPDNLPDLRLGVYRMYNWKYIT